MTASTEKTTSEKITGMDRSPLARPFPAIPEIIGVARATARAGYRAAPRDDVLLVTFPEGTTVAGLTTRSKCPSPEVELCRDHLAGGKARALVVNSGNSNAFTGARGRDACAAQVAAVARLVGCPSEQVFSSSTGVIGVPLPADKACAGATAAHAKLGRASWEDAVRAIQTTDTFAKGALRSVAIAGTAVTLAGIIKGSGMIAPDMGTMLGYIFTDAAISAPVLGDMLRAGNRHSFSCITVDSDTSTSDTVLAFATGGAGNPPIAAADSTGAKEFADALASLMQELARLVVRDGEGASKFVEITVSGATSDDSARRIGLSVANSPLVKTAIAGEDANWGRVVAAVGKAGEPAERDLLAISFGDTTVAAKGAVVPGYDEAPVARHLKGTDVHIGIDIGLGGGKATVWTCDLTHRYISINADYRS